MPIWVSPKFSQGGLFISFIDLFGLFSMCIEIGLFGFMHMNLTGNNIFSSFQNVDSCMMSNFGLSDVDCDFVTEIGFASKHGYKVWAGSFLDDNKP